MQVAVVGASGVFGRTVLPLLLERGHRVRAIVRDPRAFVTAVAGCEVVAADILQLPTLGPALEGCDAVMHLATAIPKPGGAIDWTLNDRIRREGTRNLIEATRLGRPRYLQQSVAMLLAGSPDTLADESAPIRPIPVLQSAADMERLVADSGLPWQILRFGAFYGPGTGRSKELNELSRAGKLVIPGDGGDYLSLLRVEDAAGAVVCALETGASESLLNIVDDHPVTYRELYNFIARVNNAPPPPYGGPGFLPSFRVSNERARARLGWKPRFPDYRVGWILH